MTSHAQARASGVEAVAVSAADHTVGEMEKNPESSEALERGSQSAAVDLVLRHDEAMQEESATSAHSVQQSVCRIGVQGAVRAAEPEGLLVSASMQPICARTKRKMRTVQDWSKDGAEGEQKKMQKCLLTTETYLDTASMADAQDVSALIHTPSNPMDVFAVEALRGLRSGAGAKEFRVLPCQTNRSVLLWENLIPCVLRHILVSRSKAKECRPCAKGWPRIQVRETQCVRTRVVEDFRNLGARHARFVA